MVINRYTLTLYFRKAEQMKHGKLPVKAYSFPSLLAGTHKVPLSMVLSINHNGHHRLGWLVSILITDLGVF